MTFKKNIEKIKSSQSFSAAVQCLNDLQGNTDLSPRNVQTLGRAVSSIIDSPDVKVGILSNFTTDMLPGYLSYFCATEGLQCKSHIGAFNQYFQEIVGSNSGLKTFQPDIIFLTLSLRTLEPEIVNSFASLSERSKEKLSDRIIAHIEQTINSAIQQFSSTILLSNFSLPSTSQLGIADNNDALGEQEFYYKLNSRIAELVKSNARAHIFDMAKLTNRFGVDNIFDPKMYYMAKILWSESFSIEVAKELLKFIWAIKGKTKKCLVLDLDNTLWGGILGEDGVEGVKVGQGDPISESYLDFQYKIKSLKNRGIMLGICSKNNENDVREMFAKRTSMPLQLTDFSAMEINWDHKYINIQRIANGLNIGTDSIVFIDDNPVECELIRQMLPAVKTILLPNSPENIPGVIDKTIDFEKIVILSDDKTKTEQYLQNKQREDFKDSSCDLTTYLKSLKTEIWIRPAAKENIARVHQLFSKTNQFNVSTIRYSEGEIEKFLAEENYELGIVSSRDRFGDLGIIGLYLLNTQSTQTTIDSFILSCRAMGRGIESAIMNYIKSCYSAQTIQASYTPTKKNIPVKTFFEEQGFNVIEQRKDGGKSYIMLPDKIKMEACSWIKLRV